MTYNPLLKLSDLGQSIWLDYLRRDMLESGELSRLIKTDGLRGLTSNPKIFWKAIDGSDDYTTAIQVLSDEGKSKEEIYRTLTVEDVQHAADTFRPVFNELNGADGFVSLEVNPHLARDIEGTIKEAEELWQALDRPNVFIKVPATKEGLTCIRRLIAEGINVNVTLLFGLDRYREVAEAYIAGLEDRIKRGESLTGISSVASFFLSRIDVKVDPQLEDLKKQGGQKGKTAGELHGEVAIASARIAYQIYKEIFEGDRFQKLADQGARPQRVLWASTSTKNPDYSDIKYVEALIGPNTVNTVPQETLNAYRDHGSPAKRLEGDVEKAVSVLKRLSETGIEIAKVTAELIEEGIEKFNKPYDQTLESLENKIKQARGKAVDPQEMLLEESEQVVSTRIAKLADEEFSRRLWEKDTSLWTQDQNTRQQIGNSLGWLDVAEKMISNVSELKRFATDIRKAGFLHVVHLGMGGSSLAPLVFQRTLTPGTDSLPLDVLDSTDPQSVLAIEEKIPLKDTLFIVASKSGTTTETLSFMEYFYHRVAAEKGEKTGENFIAITDPGSPLVNTAKSYGFQRVFLNYEDIGGRYSALSYFGMVPAVLMDLDIELLLERAVRMAYANRCQRSGAKNPAIELGAALGELASQGRDKLTFLTSKSISNLGLWLEQLVAESTGKKDKGILPVAGENVGVREIYGDDRVFVYFEVQDEKYDEELKQVRELADAGFPVVIIRLQDKYDIGQEMMRWEIAIATAGAVLGINPFDQPNVQAAKDSSKRVLRAIAEEGSLPPVHSSTADDEKDIVVDQEKQSIEESLSRFLSKVKQNDYIAIQAYLAETPEADRLLQDIRTHLRDRYQIATTVGYGPRYLHSTGQYHKGGPNTGVFIQLWAERAEDADIPGKDYSFGVLIKAQAQGDLEALRQHERRLVRIELGLGGLKGLSRLNEAVVDLAHERA
jgi:transaldolase/glucose-6-phosphate isomerase